MSDRPWYPFYPGEHFRKTHHLTLEQEGALRRCLDYQWVYGAVPESNARLAKEVLLVHHHKAASNWRVIAEYFQLYPEGYKNTRLEKERSKAIEISKKRAKAGKAGGQANALANATNLLGTVTVTTTKRSTPPKSPPKPKLPDWIPADTWKDFCSHRKAIGKKVTPEAQKLAVGKLEKLRAEGQDVRQILEQSIANGWTGLFPVKVNGHRADSVPEGQGAPAFNLMGNEALSRAADKMGVSLQGMSTQDAARYLASKFRQP